jgi:hypothetical protein
MSFFHFRLFSISVFAVLSLGSAHLNAATMELVPDRSFANEVNVINPKTKSVEGVFRWDTSSQSIPRWSLAQWFSASNIMGTLPVWVSERDALMRKWQNQHKVFAFGQYAHSLGRMELTVNSQNEYNDLFRDGSVKDWPHLLLSSKIGSPTGWLAGKAPWISSMSRLDYTFRGKLRYAKNKTNNDRAGNRYNPSIHAAQFHVFFTIQCLKKGSPDYGKYVWFGIKAYDSRTPKIPLIISDDAQTGQLIYNIGINELKPNVTFHDGNEHTITGNILPQVKDAIQEAVAQGYLSSNQPSDYTIGGMNFGWEVPGLSIVTFQVRDISLIATY